MPTFLQKAEGQQRAVGLQRLQHQLAPLIVLYIKIRPNKTENANKVIKMKQQTLQENNHQVIIHKTTYVIYTLQRNTKRPKIQENQTIKRNKVL